MRPKLSLKPSWSTKHQTASCSTRALNLLWSPCCLTPVSHAAGTGCEPDVSSCLVNIPCLPWSKEKGDFCAPFWWAFSSVMLIIAFLSLQSAIFRDWADCYRPPCSSISCFKTWGWLMQPSRRTWLRDPPPTSCPFRRGESELPSHQVWQLDYSCIL